MSLLILLVVLAVYADHAMTRAAARREQTRVQQDLRRTRHLPRTQVTRDHYARHPFDARTPLKEGRP